MSLQVENKEFPAHRSVLSVFSKNFLKMFTIEIKEQYSQVIVIEHVIAEALKEILKAMYDGEIRFTEVNIAEIIHVASLMPVCCVLHVADECIIYNINRKECTIHNINSENCSSYLDLANLYLFVVASAIKPNSKLFVIL